MGTTTWVPGPGTGAGTPGARHRQHAPGEWAAGHRDPPSPPSPSPGRARHALTIGRIAGIPIELHWTFFALLALVVVLQAPGGAVAVGAGLAWIGILFASVVVHELAHCLVARRRGSRVLGILLLPIGGMSRMASLPPDPGGEAAVAAAGPGVSLGIGAGALVLGALFGSHVVPPTLVAGSWWARIGWLNLLLGAFNLLPALPMDGGRILRAALSRRRSALSATRIATSVARVIAVGLMAAGVFYDLWLVAIGIFVYLGASAELGRAQAAARPAEPGNGFGAWQAPGGQRRPPHGWAPPPARWWQAPDGSWHPVPDGWAPPPDGWAPAPAAGWPPPYGWWHGQAGGAAQGRWQAPPAWGPPTGPPAARDDAQSPQHSSR